MNTHRIVAKVMNGNHDRKMRFASPKAECPRGTPP